MGPPIFIGGKQRLYESTQVERIKASMGPPIFIGGKFSTLPDRSPLNIASMGPPIFIGGKLTLFTNSVQGLLWLQWGRRFLSAERVYQIFPPDYQRKASMGPPIFIGGKDNKCSTVILQP